MNFEKKSIAYGTFLVSGLIAICLIFSASLKGLEGKIADKASEQISSQLIEKLNSDSELGYVGDSPTYLTNKRPGTLVIFSNIFTPGDLEVSGTSYLQGLNVYSSLAAGGVLTTNAGHLRSYTIATSSTATAQVLVQADLLNYDTVLFTPNTNSITLTLPATSTLTSFIPTAGDMAEQCWYNATSTAAKTITFAAGAGMDLERVATSTTSGSAGVLAISPQTSACFKFFRETDTDISVLMTNYLNAD